MRKLEKFLETLRNIFNFNTISNFGGVVGGVLLFLLGGWDTLIMTLVVLMCLDYLTGHLKGLYNKELSSKTGRKGIIKKIQTLIVVSVAVMCEKIGIPAMREMTIMFFVVNEGLSILENTAQMGLPLPDNLKNALIQIRESKGGKTENEEN